MVGGAVPVIHEAQQFGIVEFFDGTVFEDRKFEFEGGIGFNGFSVRGHFGGAFVAGIDCGDRTAGSILAGVGFYRDVGNELDAVWVAVGGSSLRRGFLGRGFKNATAGDEAGEDGYVGEIFQHILHYEDIGMGQR